eukprot:10585778-Prorocentrum_lima.AAC.1
MVPQQDISIHAGAPVEGRPTTTPPWDGIILVYGKSWWNNLRGIMEPMDPWDASARRICTSTRTTQSTLSSLESHQ